MKLGGLLLIVLSLACSCKKEESPVNKFTDSVLVTIADLQDRRLGDSLRTYLNSPTSLYRREAALAYASLQDSNYVADLQKVLNDPDSSVRKAATYSLGQTHSLRSERILFEAAGNETNKSVHAALIEAYGKVSHEWKLNLSPADSLRSRAIAWSYYRMAVRGLSDQSLNTRAKELLRNVDMDTRLAAAHYFARGAKDYAGAENALIQAAKYDNVSEVRMAAVHALRKIKSDSSHAAVEYSLRKDPDYLVRVNAVRALQDFPFEQTKTALLESLDDSIVSVGIAASEVIKSSITKKHWLEFKEAARASKNWRIQANLYEAALSVSDHKELADEIRSVYNTSSNQYQKAALLMALQHDILSNGFVHDQLLKSNEPVIKISAASALIGMNYHKNFKPTLKRKFATRYEDAIKDGDVAVIGIITGALADSALDYKSIITDYSFLRNARNNLSLPKDFEAILPLETAIAYFEGRKMSSPLKNEFNHPIPWNLVKRIPSNQKCIINTSKGPITIRLFVNEAPGSVANFVYLALDHYYDGKFFHRVVPNFVVQSGCPRGDGWGSEAYSIRSEFSTRRYKAGSMGMASAGKDTEGTQWFITHSPTPHLDGRYTIFAEVESGMDIVHQIEVGDRILSVEIINLKPL